MANRRDKIIAALTGTKFDYLVTGTNLYAALRCYSLAVEGKKVALCQSGDFEREDHFQTTSIFPKSIFSPLKVRKKLELLEQFRCLFPHLVLQQRVLNIGLSGFCSRLSSSIFNILVAAGQHQQSMTIDMRKYPEFKHLSGSGFRTAILSREFKVNVPRLTIEILKAAESKGAIIVNYLEISSRNEKIIFEDQLSRKEGVVTTNKIYEAETPSFSLIERNIDEDEKLKNTLRVFGKLADYQITFPSNPKCQVGAVNCKIAANVSTSKLTAEKKLLQKVLKTINDEDFAQMIEIQKDKNLDVLKIVPNLRIDEVHKHSTNTFPRLSTIKLPKQSTCWIEGKSELNHVTTTADALYDEARQTGIEKDEFLPIYYRFGSNTREITEFAYEKLAGENAASAQHWDLAIRRFEEISEWKIE